MNIFLIDADNLNSGAWVDEAFRVLEETEGRMPVRRAYGSAENLKALADTLRDWAVRPFVNLALTKNTTDLALAVDAMELACQLPAPRLIVIGSGDADFTPLVVRLRERGIRVVCVSERSKMGREAVPAYDRVILVGQETAPLVAAAQTGLAVPARKAPRKTAAKKTTTSATLAESASQLELPVKKAAAKKTVRQKAVPVPEAPERKAPQKTPVSTQVPAKLGPPADKSDATQVPNPEVAAILVAVPALQTGQPQPINVVTKALRDARLLGKNAASPKLLRKLQDFFELLPAEKPNLVRYTLLSETS